MQPDMLLLPGPMVGAASRGPLAEALRAAGRRVILPDVLGAVGDMPPWADWPP